MRGWWRVATSPTWASSACPHVGRSPRPLAMLRLVRTRLFLVCVFAIGCATADRKAGTPTLLASAPVAAKVAGPGCAEIEARGTALKLQAVERMKARDHRRALELHREAWELGFRRFAVAYNAACSASLLGENDEALLWLQRLVDDLNFRAFDRLEADDDLIGVRKSPGWAALVKGTGERTEARNRTLGVGAGLDPSTPAAEGIDPVALELLVKKAQEAGSIALVVVRNGALVGEWYFGHWRSASESMSATKSVTALAIALLLDEGTIKSLDEPVWTFFPEWNQGKKKLITLRHLLSHTSGLQSARDATEIYASPDFVKLALAAELSSTPGTEFFYNNKAVNLLSGVVKVASGKRMDDYLREKLFEPLGIRDVLWTLDGCGNPHGMSGLQIRAVDFAKVGQLMLDGGRWKGKQVISSQTVKLLTSPSQALAPAYGLLWWVDYEHETLELEPAALAALEKTGLSRTLLDKVRPLAGKPMATRAMLKHLAEILGPEGSKQLFAGMAEAKVRLKYAVAGGITGFSARGYLGQYLRVVPSKKLVVVRMAEHTDKVPSDKLEFGDFDDLVFALTR